MGEGIKKVIIKVCYTVIQTIPSTQWGRELAVKMPPKKVTHVSSTHISLDKESQKATHLASEKMSKCSSSMGLKENQNIHEVS